MPRFQDGGKPTLRKHADKELDGILRPLNDGTSEPVAVRAVTLNMLLERHWPAYVERQKMRPSTLDGYNAMLTKWIKPNLGEKELADVTPEMITEFMKKLVEAKLADKYQKNIYNLTTLLFELAKTYDLIVKNPVRPLLHRPSVERTEKDQIPREKVRDFFIALPIAWRTPVLTLLLTGMRLHMFRHTAGSVVYAVTGDLKKAQEQLGHADIQTTGNIYVSLRPRPKTRSGKSP